MFKETIKIFGKHADIIKKYSKTSSAKEEILFQVTGLDGELKEVYIFNDYMEAYMIAAMVGIIENRKAEVDDSTPTSATIFTEVMEHRSHYLKNIVKYMILKEESEDVDLRIKKAFSMEKEDEEDKNLQKELDAYMRAGLEIINDYFKDCANYTDLGNELLQFLTDYSLVKED